MCVCVHDWWMQLPIVLPNEYYVVFASLLSEPCTHIYIYIYIYIYMLHYIYHGMWLVGFDDAQGVLPVERSCASFIVGHTYMKLMRG